MAVEIFSWPSLHERMCRTWKSNSGPLACQADMLPIELPRPAYDRWVWNKNTTGTFIHCNSLLSNVCKQLLPETESNMIKSYIYQSLMNNAFEPSNDKTNKMTVPSEDSDQTGRISLGIRPVWSVFAVHSRVAKEPSFLVSDSEDWSDWADAQTDLSVRWAHNHFVRFVMRRLILYKHNSFILSLA